jgi:hypothetical protein
MSEDANLSSMTTLCSQQCSCDVVTFWDGYTHFRFAACSSPTPSCRTNREEERVGDDALFRTSMTSNATCSMSLVPMRAITYW